MLEQKDWTWSFSSLQLADSCAKKYWVLRHKKLMIEPSGPAAEEGTRIHEAIDKYMKTGIFTADLLKWQKLLTTYYEKGGQSEAEYAFNKKLERVDFRAPDVWFRGIIDWCKINGDSAEIADWKSGKVKPTGQMRFYAYVIFLAHPEINKVKGTFEWINKFDKLTDWYKREDMAKLFRPSQEILDKIKVYEETETWPEQSGFHCKWCSVTKEYCSQGKDPLPVL